MIYVNKFCHFECELGLLFKTDIYTSKPVHGFLQGGILVICIFLHSVQQLFDSIQNLGFLLKIYRLASNLVVSIICCSAAADAVAVDAAARSGDFLDDVTEG